MRPDENEVVEVEVLDEKIDEPREIEVKKMPSTDHSKAIERNSTIARILLRFGPTVFFVFLLLAFYFTILAGQQGGEWAKPAMFIFYAACLLGVIATIVGRICLARVKHLIDKDPNYKNRL